MYIADQGRRGTSGRHVRPISEVGSPSFATKRQSATPPEEQAPDPARSGLPATVQAGGCDGAARPRFGVSAALVAQLIAGRLGLPQTRSLRRAAPEDALSAYQEMAIRLRVRPPRCAGVRA